MANDVRIVVTADDLTKAGLDSAERRSKETSDKIGTGLDGLGAKGEQAGKKIKTGFEDGSQGAKDFDRLVTSSLKDGETAFDSVSHSIDEMKTKIEGLKSDVRETGSRSIFGDLTAAEADLKRLEGFFDQMVADIPQRSKAESSGREVGDMLAKGVESVPFVGGAANGMAKFLMNFVKDAAKVGEEAGEALGQGMTSAGEAAAQDLPQLFTPQGLIGAAILATIAGGLAVVAGGLLASVMAVAVGGGLIAASALVLRNNATLVASFGKLKTDIGAQLKDAAAPLVGPFDKAIDNIDAKFASVDFGAMFASVAPAIEPVLTGLGNFVAYLIPKLTSVGKVFTQMFADPEVDSQLNRLGVAIGVMFQRIGDHPQEVEDFFKLLIAIVREAVVAIDVLIGAAGALDSVWHKLTGWIPGMGSASKAVDGVSKSVGSLTDATGKAMPDFDAFIQNLGHVTNTASTAAGALTDKLIGGLLNSDIAANDFDKSLVTLGDTLEANGGHLTAHVAALKKSESGAMQNKDAVLAVVQANLRMYDSQIQAGISSADAAEQYDRNTKALEAQLKAGGMLPPQIDALIGKYRNVPDAVNTDLAINGLTDAITNLTDLERLINHIADTATITITSQYKETHVVGGGNAGSPQRVSSPVQHKPVKHASGGILGSEPSTVSEEGWEVLRMPGAMVSSHADSVSQAGQGGGGKLQVEVSMAPVVAGGLVREIMKSIRVEVRHLGAEAALGINKKSLGIA